MLKNGEKWFDTNGNQIHAHGGWLLKVEDWFYWYGEDRRDNNFVSCYRTKDFKTFEFRNHILTSDSVCEKINGTEYNMSLCREESFFDNQIPHGIPRKIGGMILANIERPKVIYCEKTQKYILWMHYENGFNYRDANCAFATCDTPDGDFIYHGSFRPFGNMSRDCTVFESNSKMYFISTANDNKDLCVYRMSDDYLSLEENVSVLFCGQSREAPSFFRKDGRVFLLSSFCTGWAPNQGKFSYSKDGSLEGEWSQLKNFGDETTFFSQPTFVLSLQQDSVMKYYYFGDRWGGSGEKYFESSYVVLEIKFDDCGDPFIEYSDMAQMPEI